jgi:thioredoxin-like negative regulator of GroEL
MTLLYFSTPSCQPCKNLFPYVQEVCSSRGVALQKIDATQDPSLVSQYQVTGVPTVVLLGDNGNTLFRHTGIFPKVKLEISIDSAK